MGQAITLEALEVLDAIDRKGSFAAAADELYRVPSALSYTIRKLEQDLDINLYQREGRRSVLTPAGRLVLEEGRRILEASRTLSENARRVANGWEPRLSIALESIFPVALLFPALREFYLLYPGIEFNLHEEVLAGTWDGLLAGRTDLVLGAPNMPPLQKDLTIVPLCEIEMVVVAAPEHPVTELQQPLAREDLNPYRNVVVRDSSRHLAPISRGLHTPHTVLSVSGMEAKIEAHCAGLGVGAVPRFRVREHLQQGRLEEVMMREPPQPEQFYMGWRSNNRGKALQWLVQAMPAMFADIN